MPRIAEVARVRGKEARLGALRTLDPIQKLRFTAGVTPSSAPERLLRSAGLRVTRPRLAVLAALASHPHADTETVVAHVRGSAGTVSRQAVYDVLHALTAAGIVRRIQPSGHLARYETRVGDNHHHVVCRGCGRIADVDCAVGEVPCLTAADDAGFEVDEAEVIWWGSCASCRAASTPSAPPPTTPE